MCKLPNSTYGMYEWFKWGMHAKQEHIDSLNYFNETAFLTHVYLSFFATKKVVLFIEAAPVSTPCCLPSLLATANQISRLGEAPHGSRVYRGEAPQRSRVYRGEAPHGSRVYRWKSCVCGQYTRQDHLMENSEKLLQ